jgi:hypothetical protein
MHIEAELNFHIVSIVFYQTHLQHPIFRSPDHDGELSRKRGRDCFLHPTSTSVTPFTSKNTISFPRRKNVLGHACKTFRSQGQIADHWSWTTSTDQQLLVVLSLAASSVIIDERAVYILKAALCGKEIFFDFLLDPLAGVYSIALKKSEMLGWTSARKIGRCHHRTA